MATDHQVFVASLLGSLRDATGEYDSARRATRETKDAITTTEHRLSLLRELLLMEGVEMNEDDERRN